MHVCMYECMYIIYPSTGRRRVAMLTIGGRIPRASAIRWDLSFE